MTSERGRQPFVPACRGDDDPVLLHCGLEHSAFVDRLKACVDWSLAAVRSRAESPRSDRDLRPVVTPFHDGMGVGGCHVPAWRVVQFDVQVEGLHQFCQVRTHRESTAHAITQGREARRPALQGRTQHR